MDRRIISGKGLSRRSFLQCTLAVGATASLGLTGCALENGTGSTEEAAPTPRQTQDVSQAVWPSIEYLEPKAAGEGTIAFVEDTIPESDIVATHDVDVVVCGLGPAGDAAALSCAEQGLRTVAVEKRAAGNYNSATLSGTDSRIHKYWGVAYDRKEWLDDAMVNCSYHGNQDLYRFWLEHNGEAVDWYIGHFGKTDDAYPLTFAAGDFPDFREPYDKTSLSRSWNTMFNLPIAVTSLPSTLADCITAAGAEIRYNCPACQLVVDGDTVTGVIVKSDAGYERYDCAKGVVLSTGGYEFNPEMLEERCRPRDLAIGGWLTMASESTGDGLLMGLAAGAIEDEYPQALMLDPEQLMPYLRVNKLGRRFTAEYEAYNHVAMAIQNQPGAYCYYVVDGNLASKIDKIWTPSSSPYGPKESWVQAATGTGALKADTLGELAQKMDVPEDTFVASIQHWNEMAAAGADTDYMFPGGMMMTIDTPPYYATKELTLGLCTVGGLQVDENSQVLDQSLSPIEGLYALGLTAGSMYYNTYQHNLNGLSHTRNITTGYFVGKTLASK